MPLVSDIIRLLEQIAPHRLAEEWDNAGLQIGNRGWNVSRIMIALDPILPVVKAACKNTTDLLITHHPLIFSPLKQIDFSTPQGEIIALAANKRLSIISAHTNLDSAAGGLNDLLALKLGLRDLEPLLAPAGERFAPEAGVGLGRIGTLEKATDLASFADDIKERFSLSSVRIAGAPGLAVRKVAVCTGSGSGLLKQFYASDAQVFVTGDLRYHDVQEARERQRGIIDIGHFASEHLMIDMVKARLETLAAQEGYNVDIEAFGGESDPFAVR